MAKSLEDTFVCPYLIDIKPIDIPAGPLPQFQAKSATKEGTWELLVSLNKALKDSSLPEEQLKRAFDRCWPEFFAKLSQLSHDDNSIIAERTAEDKIEEILLIVRELTRQYPKYLLQLEPGSDVDIIKMTTASPVIADITQKAGRVNRESTDKAGT